MRDNIKELFKKIDRGRQGLNKGLSTGLGKLDSITSGIQRESFVLVGGDSGSGKSAYVYYAYLYNAYKDYLRSKETAEPLNMHWLIFSWELTRDEVLTRILATKIYEDTGKVISLKNIFSRDVILSDADYELICKYIDWLNEFDSLSTIIDNYCTAAGVYRITCDWLSQFGKMSEKDEYGRIHYIPNDPKQYLIAVVDHIGLVKIDSGHNRKQEMDLASEYFITLKNRCAMTVCMVQQLNRGFKSMDRRTAADGRYQGVEMQDFAETSATQNAATVILGMFYPWREKLKSYAQYDISKLQDRARTITVLKNRYGPADKLVGLTFFGEIGLWRELSSPDKMQPEDYDKYIAL